MHWTGDPNTTLSGLTVSCVFMALISHPITKVSVVDGSSGWKQVCHTHMHCSLLACITCVAYVVVSSSQVLEARIRNRTGHYILVAYCMLHVVCLGLSLRPGLVWVKTYGGNFDSCIGCNISLDGAERRAVAQGMLVDCL